MRKRAVILESSAFFKRGEIVDDYIIEGDGIIVNGKFINENNYIILKEKFTKSEEDQIRELIKNQLKVLFYNIYSKQTMLLNK